jgi:hypothetical protein
MRVRKQWESAAKKMSLEGPHSANLGELGCPLLSMFHRARKHTLQSMIYYHSHQSASHRSVWNGKFAFKLSVLCEKASIFTNTMLEIKLRIKLGPHPRNGASVVVLNKLV